MTHLVAPATQALALILAIMLWAFIWQLSDMCQTVTQAALRLRSLHRVPDPDPFGPPAEPFVCPVGFNITIVYNALVWPDNDWRTIIGAQLHHLQASGLPACSSVHVVLSQPPSHPGVTNAELVAELRAAEAFAVSTPGAASYTIHTFPANLYEYPGLRLAWDLAQEVGADGDGDGDGDKGADGGADGDAARPTRTSSSRSTLLTRTRSSDEDAARSHLFLYFHSKGMVNSNGTKRRSYTEYRLFHGTVERWREAVRALASHPHTDLTGMYPSETGYVWYNFWWARASYLQLLEAPQITSDRYYYEKWLGKGAAGSPPGLGGCATCWSLCTDAIGKFGPAQAASMPDCKFPTPEFVGFDELY